MVVGFSGLNQPHTVNVTAPFCRMPYCQACRLGYNDKEIRYMNLKMHSFPRKDWQQNFLISWLSFCGMPLQVYTSHLKNKFVCSKHFERDDYFPGGNRRLRYDAVPHLCPPSELVEDGDPTKNIATRPIKKKNLYDLGRREMFENVKRQLCRICGKREGLLKPIFEESSTELILDSSVATKIKLYLPVKIEDNESLPQNICSKCSDLLEQFHEMSVTCLAVDNMLRKTFEVDETDALFQDAKERAEEERIQTKRFKQHLQQTVLKVLRNHNAVFGETAKPVETIEPQSSDPGKTSKEEPRPKLKQFVCGFCGEVFKYFKHRTAHIAACRELPGVCEVCGKEFPRKDLRKHLKQAHTCPRNFMCDKCAKCFRSMQALDYHTKTKHEVTSDIKFYCEHCCKTFSSRISYEGHLKCHETGNINVIFNIETNGLDEECVVYKCPVCEVICDDKVSLIVHLNAPADMKCGICLSRFHCEKSYLVHQSADKWMCRHCDKLFCYKHSVVAHERVHTGERPYKCMVCELRFRTLAHKAKHQAVHYPPKYQCMFCHKKFRYKSPFEDHVNLHISKVISCKLCGKTFGGKFSLFRHARRYHSSKAEDQKSFIQLDGVDGANFDTGGIQSVDFFSVT